MHRGVLILTREELLDLVKHVDFDKLNIASNNIKDVNKIFVNEEDLEVILDQIGLISGSEVLGSTREKVAELLRSFRS